ncbi:Myb-like DNA-binding domain containing protein [Histomonas meleagridis]|uniref:Myb-like DNA-binding domain containing protein n=1 Tax=Histomonas meleagridis TaxID=135588 RepID=UPI00355A6295|nr:Myb-like DNA-binding domain containing protein [Histomonas meleagridis]KAH0804166.1 Myb-like DNA-binding domain containing protein [Histomonas meleagridis]
MNMFFCQQPYPMPTPPPPQRQRHKRTLGQEPPLSFPGVPINYNDKEISAKHLYPIEIIKYLKDPQNTDKTIPSKIIKKIPWSKEEDEMLTVAVYQFGTKRWKDVSKFVPLRDTEQCRERWNMKTLPATRTDPFDNYEDAIILKMYKMVGGRWSLIAKSLPGRTPEAIRNRWKTYLKQFARHSKPFDAINGFGLNTIPDNVLFNPMARANQNPLNQTQSQ